MTEPEDLAPTQKPSAARVALTLDDRVARISLNNPPLNVFSLEVMAEITDAVHRAAKADGVCAFLFEAAPEARAFSAGIAMEEHRGEVAYQVLDAFHGILRTLDYYSKPTIAVVADAALGAGCELAAFCDIVVAGERARFGLPEIKVGVFPTLASVYFPRIIGPKRAKEMILTGSLLTAREAADYGLVTYVVPDDQVASKAADVCDKLRKLSASVLEVARRAVAEGSTMSVADGLSHVEDLYLNQLMNLKDPVEGLSAFMEKRAPTWRHR
jgi:cyclohexa-1,5-dienecarbonyl-CoA hydratase